MLHVLNEILFIRMHICTLGQITNTRSGRRHGANHGRFARSHGQRAAAAGGRRRHGGQGESCVSSVAVSRVAVDVFLPAT